MKFSAIATLGLILVVPIYGLDGLNSAPALADSVKMAQVFRTDVNLPAGQTIIVRLDRQETLYIGTGERVYADLIVEEEVRSPNGLVVIPEGSIISGQFVPVSGGSRFVARSLTSRGATVRMSAESPLINDVKDPRETGVGAIAGDAAIGAGAGAVLGAIFGGGVSIEKVLGGAAASVIVGNVTAPQVTVIDPNTSLSITTNRRLAFRMQE